MNGNSYIVRYLKGQISANNIGQCLMQICAEKIADFNIDKYGSTALARKHI